MNLILRPQGGVCVYSTVQVNGRTYQSGDVIEILLCKKSRAYAKVIFIEKIRNKTNVCVQWYYRKSDLPRKYNAIKLASNELISSNHYDRINIKSISRKINEDDFFCTKFYNCKTHELHSYTEKELLTPLRYWRRYFNRSLIY